MSHLSLLWAGLRRSPTRTFLTGLSIVVAFLLFGLLRTVIDALSVGVDLAAANRLVTSPRYSIVDPLPISMLERIRSMEGVGGVASANWFGGNYQAPQNFFPKFPVDPEAWFDMYPEYTIPADQMKAFTDNRTGAVAPRQLAERFGWKIGDRIPITADIWPKRDGSLLWEFDLVGVYDGVPEQPPPDTFLFRHDYFDEARQFARGTVGWYVVRINDPARAAEIAQAIDAQFANSTSETRTATEQEFQMQFLKQTGDIGLIMTGILGAVFFTILLLTGNTMSQAFRERIPELAVLKTLGFSNVKVLLLVLGESVLLTLIAGALGLGLAMFMAPGIAAALQGFFPIFEISPLTIGAGLAIAIGLGLLVGLIPALQAMRLPIVDALRRG